MVVLISRGSNSAAAARRNPGFRASQPTPHNSCLVLLAAAEDAAHHMRDIKIRHLQLLALGACHRHCTSSPTMHTAIGSHRDESYLDAM